MKQIGGLFEKVVDLRNVQQAAWRASQGKSQRPAVARFLRNLEQEGQQISAQLRSGEFHFSQYQTFSIRDPKTRVIHAPAFRDRVVHHAMVSVLGPVFEKGATDRSYACRKGRGQHAALRRLRGWMRRGDWFLKLDVAKYYDSVCQQLLGEYLQRRFRERRVLNLLDCLLDSHQVTLAKGLPIGALTSQYLANFYLDPFDHWVLQKAQLPRYLRYMDDMIFLGSRSQLRVLRAEVYGVLDGMALKVKGAGVLNSCSLGVPFLGFTVYPDRIRLDRRGRRRLRRKWSNTRRRFSRGDIGENDLQAQGSSLFAHASLGDDLSWRRMVAKFDAFGEAQETDAPRVARRLVEQHREELPLRLPQQEQGGQSQQEQRLPGWSVSRHGDVVPSPDVVPSCAPDDESGDETMRKSAPAADICAGRAEKAAGGAAEGGGESREEGVE